MTDRDKAYLLKELTRTIDESDSTAAFCLCQRWILKDAIDLLKEQEAVSADNGKCPSCNWDFENGELDFSNINESRFYCPRCGQEVKWNDSN